MILSNSPGNHKISILFVDDEPKSRRAFERSFGEEFDVSTAEDAPSAIDALDSKPGGFAIVVCDQRMPNGSGLDVFRYMISNYPETVRIMTTAYTEYDVVVSSINEFPLFGYLQKPWNPIELENLIYRASQYYKVANRAVGEGLILPPEPKIIERKQVRLKGDDIGDAINILLLLQKASKKSTQVEGVEVIYTLTTVGDELFVGAETPGLPSRLMSISNFRDQFERLENNGLAIESSRGSEVLAHYSSERKETKSAFPASIAAQIQLAVDQLQLHFSIFLSSSSISKKVMDKSVVELEDLIVKLRSMSEMSEVGRDVASGVGVETSRFLDKLNRSRTAFRRCVTSGKIPVSAVNGVFIQYANLARHLGLPTIEPDPSMMAMLRSSQDKEENASLRNFGVVMIIVPIISIVVFQQWEGGFTSEHVGVLRLPIICLCAIAVGFGSTKLLGSIKTDAEMPIPGFNGAKISIVSTGGYAIMAAVFLIGLIFY